MIEAGKIDNVRLWFTDILGRVKGFSIGSDEVERAMEEGINFDGSSIEGFVRIEESDLVAIPDMDSFYLIDDKNGRSLIFICDIFYPEGKPVESSPRYVFKKILERIDKKNYDFYVGAELEFFYFSDREKPEVTDTKGYFDVLPYDRYDEISEEIAEKLNKLGITVEMVHHEVSENQHELDIRYENALKMADHIQIARYIVKETARENEMLATFMPKPIFGVNGSGLHIHQSLFSDENNKFFAENEEYNLSDTAKKYTAGLLKYSKDITSITNQWVNSYKRLVPGYEAPAYISWGRQNRSALVRIPSFKQNDSCRVEYRAPDPGTNPYLCLSAMLGAGLKGIEENLELPPPVEEDIYRMSEDRKKQLNIELLPDSLYAAIIETEKSNLVKNLFGEEFFRKYIENKRAEWENYRIQVTDYELEQYLSL